MATTDLERLVVQLSADVRTYQKSLDKARGATNKTAHDIESRFKTMNSKISHQFNEFGKGLLSGLVGGFAIEGIVDKIGEVIKSLAELEDEAKKAGTSAENLQALEFVGKQEGVNAEELVKALAKLNVQVGKAKFTGKGPLLEIFKANDLQFSDDVIENFKKIADLIKNAKNEQDRATIGVAAFGKGYAAILPLLEKGAALIEEEEQKARDLGIVISDELVAKAHEFEVRWTVAWASFAAIGKFSIISVAKAIDDFLTNNPGFEAFLKKLNFGADIIKKALEGESPFFTLSVGGRTIIGGTDLDQAKTKVLELQDLLKTLSSNPNTPQSSIIATIAALEEAKKKADELQKKFDLAQIKASGFGFTTSATGRQGLTGIVPEPTTIVPNKLDAETGESLKNLNKTIDKLVDVVIDFENAGGKDLGKNPFSSAAGIGQFLSSTFITEFKKAFPTLSNLSDPEILAKRNDPRFAIPVLKQFALENATALADKLKAPLDSISVAELQLAHFLGAGAAAKVLQAPAGTPIENVLSAKAIHDNPILQGKTTDEVVREANARAGLSGEIRKQQDALNDLQQSVQVDIDQMRVKEAALGKATEAQRIYARELELTHQLEAKGVTITDAVKEKIHGLAVAYEEHATSLKTAEEAEKAAAQSAKDLADAQEAAAETARQVAEAFTGAFQGFISDLVHGKKLTDALRDALINLGESLLQIGLSNLTNSLFGGAGGGLGGALGGGGGLLSGLFHGGGVVGSSGGLRLAPANAFSGAKRYHSGRIPGLRSDELPGIFKKGEIIFPNMESLSRVIRRNGGSRGGREVTQYNTFIAPDWKASVRSQNQLARSAGSELGRIQRTL